MSFGIKIGKLSIFYGSLNVIESPAQHRYILYVDAIPFFLIRDKDLIVKKKCIRFKILEPIDPKCYKFLFDVISGNKNVGDVELNKIGPVGDTIEETHYRGVEVLEWYFNDESLNTKIDNPMDATKAIELKLKFNNYKVIRN